MARPARLIACLLPAAVLVAHLLAVEWLARQRAARGELPAMAPVLYTRMVQPQAAAVVVRNAPAATAPAPAQKTSAAAVSPPRHSRGGENPGLSAASDPLLRHSREGGNPGLAAASDPLLRHSREGGNPGLPAAPDPLLRHSREGGNPGLPAAPDPLLRHSREGGNPGLAAAPAIALPVVADEPALLATEEAPASPIDAPLAPDAWPPDTRLTYRLEGSYRSGPIYGEARVLWQREGERYQARLELDVRFFGSVVMTSQGVVTPQGLVPHAFEELRAGQRRTARLRGRPAGAQDAVGQFVELGHRFATGQAVLAAGTSVQLPLVRPEGMDRWTYDVGAGELLDTPEYGPVEAFPLKPRPLAHPRGDVTAQMWFAPSLQYLPVRIQVLLGEEATLDLVVRTIEQ